MKQVDKNLKYNPYKTRNYRLLKKVQLSFIE